MSKTAEELIIEELEEFDELYNDQLDDNDDDGDEDDSGESSNASDDARSEGDGEANESEDGKKLEEDGRELKEVKEDKSESEDKDSEDEETDRYTQLLTEINRLQGEIKVPKTEVKKDSRENKYNDNQIIDFFADNTLDELLNDSSKMNSVFHQIAEFAVKTAMENMQGNLPKVVDSQVNELLTAREISSKFYTDNSDLSNVRNVVKSCADQIVQEHTDWTIGQVLEESAKRTRQSLGMPNPEDQTDITPSERVGFSKGSGGKHAKVQKISALQRELDEL